MRLTDYLHILSDKVWAGQNRIDIRAEWLDIKALTKEDVFQLPNGTTVRGEWVTEGGDKTLPAERQEPRILCKKGKLSLQFHGTNISIRLGLNPALRHFVWNPTVTMTPGRRARWACVQAAGRPVHMSTRRV